MAKKQIIYNIGFNVDSSNLKTIESELNRIGNMTFKDFSIVDQGDVQTAKKRFNEIQEAANVLGQALTASYNPKIDSINLQKFQQHLANTGTNVNVLVQKLSQVDGASKRSFRNLTADLLTAKREIKQTSKLLDSMATTFANTIKWSISSSLLTGFTGSIQKAWTYTQNLDASLNDIRIVTEKSNEEMEKFAKNANRAAKELKAGTTNFTNAALIYYQQGLNDEDVQARATTTVKAANVTGQSASEVSEQLTAVWNGYKVVAEEAELYVDKLAAVAAETAADLEELSTGMSKVASAANAMGVDVDQLSAQLSTIISVTRQDANVVGTALKTIYSRMGDLQVSGVDEFGTSLGDVSGKLQQMGIDVLDQEGNLRDMGIVIEEVAAKWGTWTDAQQQAAAVAIAGKRQYNNLIALFENWDMYESALDTSKTSAGTLQKQQDIYADSLKAKLKEISAAAERVYDALFDNESVKDMLEDVAELIDKTGVFFESIGGGKTLLLSLSGIITQLFSGKIANGFAMIGYNLNLIKKESEQDIALLKIKADIEKASDASYKEMAKLKEHELRNESLLTEEEKKQYDFLIQQIAAKRNALEIAKEEKNNAEQYYEKFWGKSITESGGNVESAQNLESNIAELESIKAGMTDVPDEKILLKAEYYTKTIAPSLEEAKKAKEILQQAKENLNNTIDTLIEPNAEKVSIEQLEKLKILQQEINNPTQPKSYAAARKEVEQILHETINTQKQVVEQLKKENTAVEEAEKEYKNLNQIKINFIKTIDVKRATQSIVQLTGALGTLGSVLNNINNLSDIIENQDLEPAEKTAQIMTSIGTTIGMVAFLFNQLKDATKGLGQAFNFTNTNLGKTITSLIAQQNFLKASNADQKKAALIQFLYASGIDKTSDELKDLTLQELTDMAVKKGLVLSNAEAAASFKLLGAAAWTSLSPYLPVILAVTVAIGILVTGIIHLTKAFKEAGDNGKTNLNNISKAAQEASNNVKDITEAYNNLKNKIEDYQKAKFAVEEMITGTEAWKKATEELNQQVIDLMSIMPELAKYVANENGVLVIAEEGLSQADKIMLQQKQNATTASSSISAKKLDLANQNLTEEQADDLLKEAQVQHNAGAGAGTGAAIGTGVGAILGAIFTVATAGMGTALLPAFVAAGTAAGAAVGAPIGAIAGDINDDIRNEILEKSYEIISEQGEQIAYNKEEFKKALFDRGVAEEDLYLVDVLLASKENTEALIANSQKIEANTAAERVMSQTAARQFLEAQQGDYFNSLSAEEQNAVSKVVAQKSGTDSEVYKDKYEYMINGLEIQDANERRIFAKKYSEVMGWNITGVDVDRNTGEATFRLVDGTTKTMSKEGMAAAVASHRAMNAVDISAILPTLQAMIEKIGVTQDSLINTALMGAVAGENTDLSSLNVTKLNELKRQVEQLSADEINDLALTLGYKDGQTYINSLKKSIADYDKEQLEISLNLSQYGLQESFNKIKTKVNDFSLQTQQQISNALINAFKVGGIEGADALSSLLSMSQIDEESATAITQAYNSIDWTQGTALNEFNLALEKQGIVLDENSIAWNNFTIAMENAVNQVYSVVSNLTSITNNLANLKEILSDVSLGEIITDEQYQQLIEWNKEFEKVFIQVPGGWMNVVSGKKLSTIIEDTQNQFLNIDKISGTFNEAKYQMNYMKSNNTEWFDSQGKFKEDKRNELQNWLDWNPALLSAFEVSSNEYHNAIFGRYQQIDKLKDIAPSLDTNAEIVMATKGYEYDESTGSWRVREGGSLTAEQLATISGLSLEEARTIINKAISQTDADDEFLTETQNKIINFLNGKGGIEEWNKLEASAKIQAVASQANGSYGKLKTFKDKFTTTEDIEAYNKLAGGYLAQEAASVGISLDSDILKSNKFDELESAIIKIRNLEIDKLSEIERQIDNTFGAEKLEALKDQKNIYQAEADAYGSAWKAIGKSREQLWEDYEKATTEEERKGILNNLELYDKWQEASYKVIDSQIEAAKYQKELSQQWIDSLRELRDLSVKINENRQKGLGRFEEDSILDKVDNAFTEIYDLQFDFNEGLDKLSKYKNTEETLEKLFGKGIFSNISSNASWWENIINVGNSVIDKAKARTWLSENSEYYDKDNGKFDYADFTKNYADEIKEVSDIYQKLEDQEKSLYENWMAAQDELLKLYDEQIEKLSKINNIYKSIINLNKIAGGSEEENETWYQKIVDNAASNFQLAQEQLTEQQKQLTNLSNDATDEQREKILNNIASATENVLSWAETYYQTLSDQFLYNLTSTTDALVAHSGQLTLANVSEAWEMELAKDEGYLDEVNASYGVDQLSRKIQMSMLETDSLTAQKKLNDLRIKQEKRLNGIIEARGKLSQYELDRANAEYELTLKQIALEEAQQTANKMKLTRDALGNYSYQYVADQDAILKAEEELAAAENNLYNMDKERNETLVSTYYTTMSEANQKIAEAQAANDEERLLRLQEYYYGDNGVLKGIKTELEASKLFFEDIASITGNDASWFEKFEITSSNIATHMYDGVNSLINEALLGSEEFNQAVQNLLSSEGKNNILYLTTTQLQTAASETNRLKEGVQDTVNAIDRIMNPETGLPNLIKITDELAAELELYTGNYTEWLKDQIEIDNKELVDNTKATNLLTQATIRLVDLMDNQKADGSLDGFKLKPSDDGTWFYDIAVNEQD